MITGYNTDVEHDGVIYHVQTEDKGLDNPLLLSLVYSGGAILASKRASYQDLIAEGFDETVLAERLQRQHRLICAAINAGRIDDLKKMSAQSRTGPLSMPPNAAPPAVENAGTGPRPQNQLQSEPAPPLLDQTVAEKFAPTDEVDPADKTERSAKLEIEPLVFESIPEPTYEPQPPAVVPHIEAEPLEFEGIPEPSYEPPPPPPVVENTQPLSLEATQPTPRRPSRPSAYTVYDSRRKAAPAEIPQAEDGLRIFLAGEKNFRGGDTIEMDVCVSQVSANGETPVAASVSVKVLGSSFRPVILSLKTNRHGVATVSTRIPNFNSGRAAIVIKATTPGQSIETRRVIHPG
jgi:hypothetical protein